MTDTLASPRPVPDAARFQPRYSGSQHSGQRLTTVPVWTAPTAAEWDDMPIGTRRAARLGPALYVTLLRDHDGWRLLPRPRLVGADLEGLRSAPRVPLDPDGVH